MGHVELLEAVVIIHLVATLYMVGLIWFVQVVHYPLMASVGDSDYREYQRQHMQRTTLVVGPPMLIEVASALALVVLIPDGRAALMAWGGFALLCLVWLSTAMFQVPAHGRLTSGYDEEAWRSLVKTNWIRTLGWSLRGVAATALLLVGAGSA